MPPAFIYFDLGNVLCFFSRPQEIRQVSQLSGVPEDKVKDVLIGSHAILWPYERGELNDEQFHAEFCRLTGSQPELAALLAADSEIFTLNTELLPLVANLEDSQIPLGLLSNICPSHWRTVTDGRYGILPGAFKKFALSYQIGVQKPDEKIYRRATELAGVPPQQIFFIDDIAKNVAAAQHFGWDAVQYTTPDALEQELHRRGVRCNF
ncbi:MAG TPA: HAD family phosphatase [Pirellulales bacterium]|jgi:putative hydrolase of the HAD superfamily|nr:HAD family phosphatase [Pirellulales bacterium]